MIMSLSLLTDVVAVRTSALFGEGNGTILLDDVNCCGDESNLLQCSHSGIGQHDCSVSETAGVICEGKSAECPVV